MKKINNLTSRFAIILNLDGILNMKSQLRVKAFALKTMKT
jgi:hypothetical protein